MKQTKRLLSALLTLCMLLSLLPSPALAAADTQRANQAGQEEAAQSEPVPLAAPEAQSAAGATIRFEPMPSSNFKVTTETGGIRSRFGEDLKGGGKPATLKLSEMPTVGRYDGYQLVSDWTYRQDGSYKASWTERKNFKNSDIIYIPLKVEVTIPAYTEYTIQIQPAADITRNSKGGAGYYVEFFDWGTSPTPSDVTFMTGDTNQPSPSENVLKRSGGARLYSNKNSSAISAEYALGMKTVRNNDASPMIYTRHIGMLVGVGESGSLLNSYHHKADVNAYISAQYIQRSLAQSVAWVGTESSHTEYSSIEAALNAFDKDAAASSGPVTLKLLTNITSSGSGYVQIKKSSGNGIIDLNGHTWTAKSFDVRNNGGSSLAIINGTLKGNGYSSQAESLLASSGDFSLQNVTLDCQKAPRGIASSGMLTTAGTCRITNATDTGVYLISGDAYLNTITPGTLTVSGASCGITGAGAYKGSVNLGYVNITGTACALSLGSATGGTWTLGTNTKLTAGSNGAQIRLEAQTGPLLKFDGKPTSPYTVSVPFPGLSSRTLTTGLSGVAENQIGGYITLAKTDPVKLFLDENGQIALRRVCVTFTTDYGSFDTQGTEKKTVNAVKQDGKLVGTPYPFAPDRDIIDNTEKVLAGWAEANDATNTIVSDIKNIVFTDDAAYKAVWESRLVTVTLLLDEGNGGATGTVYSKIQVPSDGNYGTLPTPTKPGYVFSGWHTQGTDRVNVTPDTPVQEKADHTLQGEWTAQKYTVTFNPLGGTLNGNAKQEVTYGTNYGSLPTPTRDGFKFAGWFLGTDDKNKIEATTKVNQTSDHTLYAKWDASVPVTVTLHNDGDTSQKLNLTLNGPYTCLTTPKKTGYTFQGWYTEEDGGTRVTSSTIVTNANPHTLYARWTKTVYTVSFSLGGSEGKVPDTQRITHGQTVQKPDAPTPPSGYTFAGWYPTSSDTQWNFENDKVVRNMVLVAKWTAYVPTVTLDANGGTVYNSPRAQYTGVTGGTYGRLPIPTRDGCIFDGWYTAQTGGDKVISSTPVGPTDVTLYAHWKVKVTFDSRGGEAVSPMELTAGSALSDSMPIPDRANYEFDEWQTSGGTPWDASSPVTQSLTLYAKWTGKEYTITFDAGSGSLDNPTTKKVNYGDPYGELPTPTNTDQTQKFIGWFKEESGDGTQITTTTIVDLTGDTDLYAHWKTTHTHKLGEGDNAEAGEFTAWDTNNSLPTSGKYYLTENVTLSSPVQLTADVTICLNGHTIQFADSVTSQNYMILVSGGSLTLCDCTGTGKLNGGKKATVGVLVCPSSQTGNAAFKLYGGTITGCGHGVVVAGKSTFDMFGGTITDNHVVHDSIIENVNRYVNEFGKRDEFKKYGAGVYVQGGLLADSGDTNRKTATFNMRGGEIKNNSAIDGAGVYVGSMKCYSGGGSGADDNPYAVFSMTGGTITGNTSGTGTKADNQTETQPFSGGVRCDSSTVTLGGTANISGNTGLDGVKSNLVFEHSYTGTVAKYNALITASGLTQGAEIGVSADPIPVPGAPIVIAGAESDTSAFFHSDVPECSVVYQNGKVQLSGGEFDTPHTHKICGETGTCTHAGTAHTNADTDTVTYTPLSRASVMGDGKITLGTQGETKNYVLTTDLDFTSITIRDSGTSSSSNNRDVVVNLCLNGHTLRGTDGNAVILVGKGSTLNLCDCSADHAGKITGGSCGVKAGTQASAPKAPTVNMYGGAITGNRATENGGGVCVSTDNSSRPLSFYMYGGEISGNTATGNGGGVYVDGTSLFYMYGGIITHNTAQNGGGVYVGASYLYVGGDIIIKGNSNESGAANNVYLNSTATILPATSANSALRAGASIGVRTEVNPGDSTSTTAFITPDNSSYTQAILQEIQKYFFSDAGHHVVIRNTGNPRLALATDAGSGGTGGGGGTLPEQKEFTIIFDDGTGTLEPGKTDKDGKLIGDLPTPKQPDGQGIIFDGWYKDGVKVEDPKEETFTADTILEAVWKDCTHPNKTSTSEADSCTEGGNVSYSCPDCKLTWTVFSAPQGHDWSGEWKWTNKDNELHTKTCKRNGCTETMTAPHNWVKSDEATLDCETDGTQTYKCSVCGAIKIEDLSPTGHIWSAWTAEGDNHTRTCSACNTTEKVAHVWGQETVTKPATCSAPGSATQTCTICGVTSGAQEIAKLDHTPSEWAEQDGTYHQRTCDVCHTVIETAPHEWDGGVVTDEATETKTGTMTYTCLFCAATRTEDIPVVQTTAHYAVIYDGGGAGVTGTAPQEESKTAGEQFNLPDNPFARKGYDFTGWGVAVNGEDTDLQPGDSFTMPSADVIFTAQWALKLPINLEPGDSVTLPDGTTVERSEDGETVTITPPGPEAEQTTITVPSDGTVTIKEDTKTEETPEGGTTETERIVVEIPGGSTVQTGEGPTVKIPEDNRVKVELDGTIDGLPAGSEITDGDTTVKTETDGGSVSNKGDVTFPEGGTVTVTDGDGENKVEIPKTEDGEEPIEISTGEVKPTCTVSFDMQGHGAPIDDIQVTWGTPATEPQAPTAEGYTFAGWYTAANGAESGGLSTDELGPWDFASLITENMTLYAKWEGGNPDHTHSWGKWTITVAPTLTEPGTAERECSADPSHKDTVTLPELTDTSVWTPGKRVEPTEDTPGSQEYTSEYGTVTIIIPAVEPDPPTGDTVPLNPGDSVPLPGGGEVERNEDGDTVTIDKDRDGEPEIIITVPTPPTEGDVTVDPDTGEIKVPDGSTVQPGGGDGPEITLPDGGKVDPEDGGVTPDAGGSVVVPGGGSGGGDITITPPAGGSDEDRKVTVDEDGKVEVPDGSTVQPGGGDGPEITLPDGGKVDPEDGGVTPDAGGSVVVPGGSGGSGDITITPPPAAVTRTGRSPWTRTAR